MNTAPDHAPISFAGVNTHSRGRCARHGDKDVANAAVETTLLGACPKQAQGHGQQQVGSVGQLVETSEESETSDIELVAVITTNVNVVEVGSSGYSKEIYAMMEIQNKTIPLQIDSGASINVTTQDLIGECPLKPTKTKLLMWSK